MRTSIVVVGVILVLVGLLIGALAPGEISCGLGCKASTATAQPGLVSGIVVIIIGVIVVALGFRGPKVPRKVP